MIETKQKKQIINYYQSTARDYYYLMRLPKHWGMHYALYETGGESRSQAILNTNKILAQRAGIKKNMKVFDAGCGVGGSSIWLAKNIGVEATGMTLLASEAERGMKAANIEGVADHVNLVAGDYTDTKLEAGFFNVVWAIESVCHAEDKADFIREAYRLLKPGGCLVVADGFLTNDNLGTDEKNQMQRWLDGWAIPNLASTALFKKELAEAGFKDIKIENRTKNIIKFSRWLYLMGRTVAPPISKLLKLVGKRNSAGEENIVAAVWQYKTLKKGLWSYNIISAHK